MNSQAPDLASILKTLADLTPQNQQDLQSNNSNTSTSQPNNVVHTGHNAPPFEFYHKPAPTLQSFLPPVGQSGPSRNVSIENSQKKVVDPTTILEWSAGLRCAMKTVARHENVIHEIRRHEHEEQWWNGRNALIEKLKAREEGQKKLDEVLKAVGGASISGNVVVDIARELHTFDLKVYKAQIQMVREMNTKLRGLGVPFFGTKTELVRPASKNSGQPLDGKEMINEVDLVKLQRRMLEMLEDLCND
ncbi:hypothetical protein BGHDH14_bgh02468 [Blumeria hordei DH14]|uniref:Uncharacterized protein n=1 Tax=Blumeria graminis f. sp. hordei (strain DH14) TaxID=546991 RepID=N1JLZ9_BLUG1|nr:hypothetical protein BGHDH14_bgh02468 [Blumeria hordei DH14]